MTTAEERPAHVGTDSPAGTPDTGRRLQSLDAVRGLAIVIMLAAGNPFMREHLPVQLTHPEWHGLRFADLFFPLFLFVVGVAMTLSKRTGNLRLVLRRAGLLLLLGVALSSFKHGGFYPTGVLQHIAGAYVIAWVVLRAPSRLQPAVAAGIFAAVWAAFLVMGGDDPWARTGTAAHAIDGFLFGRFSTEGTLQTVLSSITVIGGAFIGRDVRKILNREELARRVSAHAVWLIALALLLALVVPINKRLWSPSFTLLTLGTSCLWFALFIWLIDVRKHHRWATPLQELGANPIVIYVGFISLRALVSDLGHLAPVLAPLGSKSAGALLYSLAWVAVGWVVARWMFRRDLFVKI
ncbi:MAG TPA: heparan-alpha-glucosaminide N-acetyltransferase domain-containing protein [Actinomycetota bacterium]|nr:heparan-alpha-glucosaminide N-acetyltransferase domain-containing protein [Actinomycetota bacterium]